MTSKLIQLNTRFGRLILQADLGVQDRHRIWQMLCDCGNIKICKAAHVKRSIVKSCGCLQNDHQKGRKYVRHGMVGTPTYNSWNAMRSRCMYGDKPFYKNRGISVCERWSKFEFFLEDMGVRPPGTTLDRIDSNLNYTPENCRWLPAKEQSSNRRSNVFLSFNGETKTISQWAEITGFSHATINARIHRGWTPERALTAPLRKP